MRREAEVWRQRLQKAACNESLPMEAVAAWKTFQRVHLRKLDQVLDAGHGECLLAEPSFRTLVERALHHFEGERYEMLAFVIMPNHVHALFRPLGQHRVQDLCGSWKVFTAQKIQRYLGRQGGLWQKETFDRIIRDESYFRTAVRYIAQNPIKACLPEQKASVWFCNAIREANGWT